MMTCPINRRRFISLTAAATAGMTMFDVQAKTDTELMRWQGAALGAKAQIMLYGDDPVRAQEVFARCQQEITRLENIFSLYVKNSAISRLNADGHLDNPDIEFLDLLSRCLSCYQITDGAFDVTIQPLWKLYADHFSTAGAAPSGPSQQKVGETLKLVGSDKITLESRRISFTRPGMGISLNGVAQGYMTDRVAKILKVAGFDNILVHMGETYAQGHHGGGRPWTAGISSPLQDHKILMAVPLNHQALATSGGYGSPFSDQSQLHHLLDPKSGRSAQHHGAVSVVAQDATTADMLSTAFYVMDYAKVSEVWAKYPGLERAIFVDPAGRVMEFTG
jgi:thiamine biosynthesis lipoprotein